MSKNPDPFLSVLYDADLTMTQFVYLNFKGNKTYKVLKTPHLCLILPISESLVQLFQPHSFSPLAK